MTWTILAVLVAWACAGWAALERAKRKDLFEDLAEAKHGIFWGNQALDDVREKREQSAKVIENLSRQTKRLTTKLLKARHLTGQLRFHVKDLQAELNQTKESLDQSIRSRARDERARTTPLDFRSSLSTRDQFVSDPARVQWAQQLGTSQFWPDLIGVLTNATPVANGKSADYELGLIHGIRTAVTLLLSLSKHPVTNVDAPEPDYGATGVMKNWDNPEPIQPEPAPLDPDIPASFGPDQYV